MLASDTSQGLTVQPLDNSNPRLCMKTLCKTRRSLFLGVFKKVANGCRSDTCDEIGNGVTAGAH